ncbi:hypothetical protein [Paenarthrobacter sp. PH39-S1]|uniref:hypothetical protein n=1 Tax=Paenarthrobacter sp. PH39-S1 TaxID=3046204 RepID=UPI0032D8E78D
MDNASVLLSSAGVAVEIHASATALTDQIEEVLAWTVREGITNVVRHSDAATATITVETTDDRVVLTFWSDRPRPTLASGSGLRGLDARAAAVNGRIDVTRGNGSFTLRIRPAHYSSMIRILIAEDMHLIRGPMVALLTLEDDMEVVA